jgi:hypothetical protein
LKVKDGALTIPDANNLNTPKPVRQAVTSKNDFITDLKYSFEEGESNLFDGLYSRIFSGLKFVEVVKDMKRQLKGIDKVLHFNNGMQLTIDEKKRRYNYGDIILEVWSNYNQRKFGWLYTCQCDYIVYAVMPLQKVYLLPTMLLRKAWLTHQRNWTKEYRQVRAKNKYYTTVSIAIPTNILLDAISSEMQQKLA